MRELAPMLLHKPNSITAQARTNRHAHFVTEWNEVAKIHRGEGAFMPAAGELIIAMINPRIIGRVNNLERWQSSNDKNGRRACPRQR